jgi:hypothetical protein
MTDRLREAMHDLAEGVRIVDLRDRSLATSRSITRRHRLLAITSTVVAVAAIAAGAVALRPGGGDPQPIGPPPTGSISPSRTPTTPPSPSASPTPAMTGELPGTAVFVRLEFDSAADYDSAMVTVTVDRLIGGSTQSMVTMSTPQKVECPGLSSTLSPDGETLAYVTGSALAEQPGDLYVVDVAGGDPRLVATGVYCTGGLHPIWSRTPHPCG